MKKIIIAFSILSLALGSFSAKAQEETSTTSKSLIPLVRFNKDINVKFGGFVRAEYYVDSREMVGAIDGLFGFFPANRLPDAEGNDLNDVVRQNLSVQATRFNALISGPDLKKAKSSAFFEFDFTGGNSINVRLRQAWVKLAWQKADLMVGRSWNPFAETPFPNVCGLHTGIPFRPFGRGEQVRFTYKPTTNLSVLAAAFIQSEHRTPLEPSAGGDVRANPIPEFHLQLHYKTNPLSVGLLSEFKGVRPSTYTEGTLGRFKANQTLYTYAFAGYFNCNVNKFNLMGSAVYGKNLSELFQQGGYAVVSHNDETGARTYSPSTSASAWVNASYGRTWVVSLFAGYQKNLGFDDNLLEDGAFFGRWQNVDHIYRVAPSLKYSYKQWCFQAEVDYDVAAYGRIDYQDKGKVKDAEEISGVRGIMAVTFFF